MHDPALEELPAPVAEEDGGERRARRCPAERLPSPADFGALGDERAGSSPPRS